MRRIVSDEAIPNHAPWGLRRKLRLHCQKRLAMTHE